uniref:Serine-rich adhesin for platelets n=1 Tax=Macrostomum lignano TaxID=282301 RepID=A0A1I8G322_9PLAT
MRQSLSEQQLQQQQQKRRQRKQQLVELEKLKQISQQMTTQLQKKKKKKRRDSRMFTGSVQQLAESDGATVHCEMANNHGLSSEDLDFNEAAILAATGSEATSRLYCEDRGDSDSLCVEEDIETNANQCATPAGSMQQNYQQQSIAEMRRHAVKCQHRYEQLQLCQTRQHQRQLIIPKRLQLDSKSVQPQISCNSNQHFQHSQQQRECEVETEAPENRDNETDDLASTDSDMIFPPTATVTGSGQDEEDSDDANCEMKRTGEVCDRRKSAGQAHYSGNYQQPSQVPDESAITDDDGCSTSNQPQCSSNESQYRHQEYSVELSPYAMPPPPLPNSAKPPLFACPAARGTEIITITSAIVAITAVTGSPRFHPADKPITSRPAMMRKQNLSNIMQQIRQIESCEKRQNVLENRMLCTSSSNCCSRRGSMGGSRRSSGGKSAEGSPESSMNLVAGTTILCRPGSLPGLNIDGTESRRLRCAHEDANEADEFEQRRLMELRQPETDRVEYEAARRASLQAPSGSVVYNIEVPVREWPAKRAASPQKQRQLLEEARNASSLRPSASNQSTAGSQDGDLNIDMKVGEVTVSEHLDNSQKVACKFKLSAGSETAEQEVEQRQTDEEKEEVDLLPSDPQADLSGVELLNESNLTLINSHFDQQSIATPTTTSQSQLRPVSRRRQLAAVCSSLRQTLTRMDSHHQPATKPNRVPPHASGSNCANSSTTAQQRQWMTQRHQEQHQQYSSSIGYGTWNERRTGEAAVYEDSSSPTTATSMKDAPKPSARGASASQKGCLVFQHPPEVASAKQTRLMEKVACVCPDLNGQTNGQTAVCQSSLEGDCQYYSDQSLAFSWVSSLGNESNAVDLSISLDAGQNNECATINPIRRKSLSRSRRHKRRCQNLAAGEVTFQQLNIVEDHLARLNTIVPTSAKCVASDSRKTSMVKPSAVTDSAAQSSVAQAIFRPISSETSCTQDDDDELLEIRRNERCKDVNDKTDSESASDEPFLMLEALSCGHEGFDCFGCYSKRKSLTHSTTPWQQQQPPQQLSPHNSSAEPPAPLSASPRLRPSSTRSAKQSLVSSLTANSPNADVKSDTSALRDLLATVFNDPSEGRALTRALMRGILCNVESLRSTLAAALVLLKNRHGCSGPLTQAIGTADALDDLIRQLQLSQQSRSRGRSIRKRRLKQQQLQQQALFHSEIDRCTTTDDEEDKSSSASIVSDAIQKCLRRRRQQTRGRPVEHRSISGAPLNSVQCHAMSHYIIGEQFVEPSLEQRSSLECRPVTTRVVLTEACKSVSQPSRPR